MKFSHKIVAASSVLLLATVALLSGSQYFKVRDEIRSMVSDSVDEIVDGVSKRPPKSSMAEKYRAIRH